MSKPSQTQAQSAYSETPTRALPAQGQDARGSATWSERILIPRTFRIPQIPGYELTGILGKGGMGVVFAGRQVALDRPVALKMVLSPTQQTTAELLRFRSEAELVARIHHPHIVAIYELGEHEGLPYFSMEFCPGGSLDAQWERQQPIWPTVQMLVKIAAGVAAAHAVGIVHRDLKPGNVFLNAEGEPKVADFGLAKRQDVRLTDTGIAVGTPVYMSPEQAWGDRPVGPQSDVWALGVMLYQALTGKLPFLAPNAVEVLQLVVNHDPIPPQQLRRDCPADLATICLHCLHKEPERRYPDASALVADLRRFLAGQPVQVRPVSAIQHFLRWTQRNPLVAGLTLAVLLAFVTGLIGTTSFAWQAAKQAEQARQAEQLALREAQHAQTAEAEMRGVVADYLHAFSDPAWDAPQLRPLRRQLLQKAYAHYTRLADQQTDTPERLAVVAEAEYQVGYVQLCLGAPKIASTHLERARPLLVDLARAHPDDKKWGRLLGRALNNLAVAYGLQNRPTEVEQLWQAALDVRRDLVRRWPDDAELVSDLAGSLGNWAFLQNRQHQPALAEAAFREKIALYERLSAEHSDKLKYSVNVLDARTSLATHLNNQGQARIAAVLLQKIGGEAEKLLQDNPTDADLLLCAAHVARELATILGNDKQFAEAEKWARLALQFHLRASGDRVFEPGTRQQLAKTYDLLGQLLRAASKLAEAADPMRRALDVWEPLAREAGAQHQYRAGLHQAVRHLHQLCIALKVVPTSDGVLIERGYRAALSAYEQVPAAERIPEGVVEQAAVLSNLAGFYSRGNRPLEGVPLFERVEPLLAPLAQAGTLPPLGRVVRRDALMGLAEALDVLRRPAEAQKAWDRAVELTPAAERATIQARRAKSAPANP
jgi:tetratricopeptide (TPR) repeat protein